MEMYKENNWRRHLFISISIFGCILHIKSLIFFLLLGNYRDFNIWAKLYGQNIKNYDFSSIKPASFSISHSIFRSQNYWNPFSVICFLNGINCIMVRSNETKLQIWLGVCCNVNRANKQIVFFLSCSCYNVMNVLYLKLCFDGCVSNW